MDTLNLDWDAGGSSIGVVTLNRPDALNAMNTLMIQELLDPVSRTGLQRSAPMHGAHRRGNRAFSTGGDLKERNGMTNDQWRHQHHLIEDAFKALWEFPVPVIAAVEGFAYAGGCELALGTDFIVASATARVCPQGSHPRNHAGRRRSAEPGSQHRDAARREMIYTGRAIDAETAYAWGLVNRVVAAGEALESALADRRDEIAASAPMAVRMAKLSTGRGQDCDSATAYALDIAAYNVLVGSEDRLEGIAAFNEKRKPQWKNR